MLGVDGRDTRQDRRDVGRRAGHGRACLARPRDQNDEDDPHVPAFTEVLAITENANMSHRASASAVTAIGLVTMALLAACSGHSSAHAGSGQSVPASAYASASRSVSLVDECASAIAYWVGQALTPGADQGCDYQEMGLTATEYKILLAIVASARPVVQKSGLPAAQAYALESGRPQCAAYLASQPATPSASNGG